MSDLQIKNRVCLADNISRRTYGNTMAKSTIAKTQLKGDNLLALAKGLEIRAELLVLEEGQDTESLKSLERIVSKLVEAETKKLLTEAKSNLERELILFLKSDKIPQKDKNNVLAEVERLLEKYKETG